MIFLYKKWNDFCRELSLRGRKSIPAREVSRSNNKYIVLKHDVENNVSRAYKMAKIESNYGHRGSFYVQAHLMKDPKNVKLLSQMKEMGHEVSYHYDVMDSNKGNIRDAITEFAHNKQVFESYGFEINTVCQHGNPIIERVGYTSNRDFFRNDDVRKMYSNIVDIMVNFKEQANTDYTYYSDAGRKFKMIYDPINNDIVNSDDKNIVYNDLNALLFAIEKGENCIVSTHPHRWASTAVPYLAKFYLFQMIKWVAKILVKIPAFKKVMSRYYYLAKKI